MLLPQHKQRFPSLIAACLSYASPLFHRFNPSHPLEDLHHLVTQRDVVTRQTAEQFDLLGFDLGGFFSLRFIAVLPGYVPVMPVPRRDVRGRH
jgi:hypothetical protein